MLIVYFLYFFFSYRKKGILMFFFFQAEDGIRDADVTGVQTCALPILRRRAWHQLFRTPASREHRQRGWRWLRRISYGKWAFLDGGHRCPEPANHRESRNKF